jgi:hypothetical protein
MKNNFKVTIPLAILLTMMAIIYQRTTGPTYPKRFLVTLDKENQFKVKLPRSHGGETNAPVEIAKSSKTTSGTITFKRYPTDDPWKTENLIDGDGVLKFELPHQPPAGKIIYYIVLKDNGNTQELGSEKDPIYIRFKGDVPTYILAPHVFFMFLSMLFSALALFEALYNTEKFVTIARVTFSCLAFGGLFLGPIVQKYAFGVYWAGFPYDYDLTDNKLLIGVIAWLIGVVFTFKQKRRWPVVFAAIVLILVYSIPHSMRGSEYNYHKGEVGIKKTY